MPERFYVFIVLMYIVWVIWRWTQEREDESAYDDYASTKPPLYVYYNTSGLQMPMLLYFVAAAIFAVLIGAIFHKLLDNMLASIMLIIILLYAAKQNIIVRSVRISQRIDVDVPSYLTAFGNIFRIRHTPILALGQSLKYADPSYRKTLEILHTRLINGGDPAVEIHKAKKYFRNRILRNFLDDFGDELIKGNVLNKSLDRMIERANDRQVLASERRIETFGAILVIYGGILFELLLVLVFVLVAPEWMSVFVNHPIGKTGVLIMVMITGFMLMTAQRLILLSEG